LLQFNEDFSGSRAVEFAEEDFLPSAEDQSTVFNDDGDGASHQGRL